MTFQLNIIAIAAPFLSQLLLCTLSVSVFNVLSVNFSFLSFFPPALSLGSVYSILLLNVTHGFIDFYLGLLGLFEPEAQVPVIVVMISLMSLFPQH